MKFLICFTFLAIVIGIQALTDEQKQKLKDISDQCKPSSGLTQEIIDEAKQNEELFKDVKFKKHARCILEKEGLLSDSGDFNLDTVKSKLKEAGNDAAEVDRLVTKCAVKKDSPEETAHHFMGCVRKEKTGSRP